MNANTVYDVFLALPEMEKQRHIQLVSEYMEIEKNKLQLVFKKKTKKLQFTKQDAMHYLLKNVFASKKNKYL